MLAGRFPLIRPSATFSPTGGEGRDEGALAVSGAFKFKFSINRNNELKPAGPEGKTEINSPVSAAPPGLCPFPVLSRS